MVARVEAQNFFTVYLSPPGFAREQWGTRYITPDGNIKMANSETQVIINSDVVQATISGSEVKTEIVNTPPAKAGGFKLRLKAGSVDHTVDYTT